MPPPGLRTGQGGEDPEPAAQRKQPEADCRRPAQTLRAGGAAGGPGEERGHSGLLRKAHAAEPEMPQPGRPAVRGGRAGLPGVRQRPDLEPGMAEPRVFRHFRAGEGEADLLRGQPGDQHDAAGGLDDDVISRRAHANKPSRCPGSGQT